MREKHGVIESTAGWAMRWLEISLAIIAFSFLGFSWRAFVVYTLCIAASSCFVYVFLRNRWELDLLLETAFKAFERVGYGAPHRLDRLSFTSYSATDGYSGLDEIPKPLEDSIKKLIDNVTKDFILVWYNDVARGNSFVDESRRLLEMLSVEVYRRACQVDTYCLIEQTVLLFHAHLERFNKALAVVKAKNPNLKLNISFAQLLFQTYESQLFSRHPALAGPAQELSYLRKVVDSLLAALIPRDTFSCSTGRFILREIVAVEILQPLVLKLLTDPDWLNEVLTDLLTLGTITEDGVNKSAIDFVDGKDNGNGTELTGVGKHSKEELDVGNSLDQETQVTAEESSTATGDLSRETEMTSLDTEKLDTEDGKSGMDTSVESEKLYVTETSEGAVAPLTKLNLYKHSPEGAKYSDQSESFLVISMEIAAKESEHKLRNQESTNWSTEVAPSSSVDEKVSSSSLSSSWHICPSPKNSTFKSESFEEMKSNLSKMENSAGSRNLTLEEFGQSIKTLACCHNLLESEEVCPDSKGDKVQELSEVGNFPRLRSKSISLPQLCNEDAKTLDEKRIHERVKRSVSVPCNLASETKLPGPHPQVSATRRKELGSLSSISYGPGYYGSSFHSVSFYSSSESFKSVSSDDETVDAEEAKEMYEDEENKHADVRDTFSLLFQASAGNTRVFPRSKKRRSITKQAGFEDNCIQQLQHPAPEILSFPLEEQGEVTNDQYLASGGSDFCKTQEVQALEDIRERSEEELNMTRGEDGHHLDKTDPDSFFPESIFNAGRKFVLNFKPPFISSSSGSTKSSEPSVASESNSLDTAAGSVSAKDDDVGISRPESNQALSVKDGSGRRLSRSDALVFQSSESDAETWYGSPEDCVPMREEIVYGEHLGSKLTGGECVDGPAAGVVRIHPSKLITIPSTEMALETAWEPGRSKFTMYRIEVLMSDSSMHVDSHCNTVYCGK